jgi:hypothetical protein
MMLVPREALPRGGDGREIQVPTRFTAGVENQKSPKTVSSVEQFIDVPEDALVIEVQANGADLRVATGQGGTASTGNYFIIYDGSIVPLPVPAGGRLYLLRNASTDVTVTFVTHYLGT